MSRLSWENRADGDLSLRNLELAIAEFERICSDQGMVMKKRSDEDIQIAELIEEVDNGR